MESSARPNSSLLHHAIATGDIETVQNLLKLGMVDADARLQVDDEILETASRKSYASLNSFRQISMTRESIMEEEHENEESHHGNNDMPEEAGVKIVVTGDDLTHEEKIVQNEQEYPKGENTEEPHEEGEEDIEKIMKECQHEVDEENAENGELEVTVIEAPQTDNNNETEVNEGINEEKGIESEPVIKPKLERLKTEDDQGGSSLDRRSLADTIDLRLKDDNQGLFERAPSMRVKEATELDDDRASKKLLPRIKRKISLKWTKKPKKDILDQEEEEDDLTYVNLVKTRNVDNEQLDENFEGVAFFEAVRDGMDMIVQTLLETSNNYQLNMLDENGFTPAMQAAWHGQAECLEILLKHGANIDLRNATGCTATHFAAGQGHTECLKLLINDDDEQVNMKTKYGATPLLLAAKGGHKDCMTTLLNAGADPNIQYRGNQNTLLFAAGNGHYECIQTLLEHEVDLNQANSQKVTPLMRAVQQGHNTCVALLTDKGANMDFQDAIGRTAVHFAVEHNNPKGLKLLLQGGASVELKTKGGSKPLDYAERFQNTKCSEIIENYLNKLKEEREKEREQDVQIQKLQEKERSVSCISFKHFFRRRNRKNDNVLDNV